MVVLALYKGPPKKRKVWQWIEHYAIRFWTGSQYSHAELCIDGVCYGSSSRDGGVRKKVIALDPTRWDLVPLREADTAIALQWFTDHEGASYDWTNIARFVIPVLGHRGNQWICFEAIGEMLQLAATHKLTGRDLSHWARKRSPKTAE